MNYDIYDYLNIVVLLLYMYSICKLERERERGDIYYIPYAKRERKWAKKEKNKREGSLAPLSKR